MAQDMDSITPVPVTVSSNRTVSAPVGSYLMGLRIAIRKSESQAISEQLPIASVVTKGIQKLEMMPSL